MKYLWTASANKLTLHPLKVHVPTPTALAALNPPQYLVINSFKMYIYLMELCV